MSAFYINNQFPFAICVHTAGDGITGSSTITLRPTTESAAYISPAAKELIDQLKIRIAYLEAIATPVQKETKQQEK